MKAIEEDFKKRYTVTIAISFIIHLIILNLISFHLLRDLWDVPEEITLHIISAPQSSAIRKNIKRQVIEQSGQRTNKRESATLASPEVTLPEMSLDEKIAIKTPAFNTNMEKDIDNIKESGIPLNIVEKELEKLSGKSTGKADGGMSNVSDSENQFFEFRNISNKNRRVVHIPEAREIFKLEKNTDLILSFYISKEGVPYNISFVTRSFSNIEKIALNFVKSIRFEAVSYNEIDKAEIVLHFKVR